MTVSELIARLEEIKEKEGDIEVKYSYNTQGIRLRGESDIAFVVVRRKPRGKFVEIQ